MPIYMDRHDVADTITAENLAELHQKDLKIQHRFGCKGLTYWFNDKRKIAFCLIEAPDAKAIKEMHDQAHGHVPHSIIEVETGIVQSFLGRIEDPQKTQDTELNIINEDAFRTIMVISVEQLTQTKKNSSSHAAFFKGFHHAVQKIINTYEGKSVKQTDYYYLVSFKSVTKAVHAAFDIRSMNKEISKRETKTKLVLKIGLSTGLPVTKKQLIFEDAIKLAERMCKIIRGNIIISSEVSDLYKSENADSFVQRKDIFSLNRADEKFITLLMDFTDESWSDPHFKADSFIRPVGCSKSQLYRKMILLTGQSPNAFIREYRLNKASELLRKNIGNISEIAFEAGFSSPSYFTKCFKKKFGLLPVAYLHSLR